MHYMQNEYNQHVSYKRTDSTQHRASVGDAHGQGVRRNLFVIQRLSQRNYPRGRINGKDPRQYDRAGRDSMHGVRLSVIGIHVRRDKIHQPPHAWTKGRGGDRISFVHRD